MFFCSKLDCFIIKLIERLELKERVREANKEVKMIQNQINYILDR